MEKFKICSISDEYIRFLRSDERLNNVFDNKENRRVHSRKYIGILVNNRAKSYFIPFSSPKKSDFHIDNNGKKDIKKSTKTIIRMTALNTDGELELKGCLKINNMIPVPKDEICQYMIEEEKDYNYKIIIEKEFEFIKNNIEIIKKRANVVYSQKVNEEQYFKDKEKPGYLESTVDFRYAEQKCEEYIQLKRSLEPQLIRCEKELMQDVVLENELDLER